MECGIIILGADVFTKLIGVLFCERKIYLVFVFLCCLEYLRAKEYFVIVEEIKEWRCKTSGPVQKLIILDIFLQKFGRLRESPLFQAFRNLIVHFCHYCIREIIKSGRIIPNRCFRLIRGDGNATLVVGRMSVRVFNST